MIEVAHTLRFDPAPTRRTDEMAYPLRKLAVVAVTAAIAALSSAGVTLAPSITDGTSNTITFSTTTRTAA